MVNKYEIDSTGVEIGDILEVTLYRGIQLTHLDDRLSLPIVCPKGKLSDGPGRKVVGYVLAPLFLCSNLDDCVQLSSSWDKKERRLSDEEKMRLMYIRYDCIHSCRKVE